MVSNPKCAVNGRAEEHTSTRPPMNVIELLVSIPWAEEKRQYGILGSEEENDRELRKGKETCSVGICDEDSVCGDADDYSSKVSRDQHHLRKM